MGYGPNARVIKAHSFISRFTTRIIIKLLSGLIVYSSSAKKYYESLGASNVVVGYNTSVNDSDILPYAQLSHNLDAKFSVAYIGKISPSKKIEDLINALTLLPSDDWSLDIYGAGPIDYLSYIKNSIPIILRSDLGDPSMEVRTNFFIQGI